MATMATTTATPERAMRHSAKPSAAPVAWVLGAVLLLWYAGAIGLNTAGTIERVLAPRGDWGLAEIGRAHV